MKTTNQVLTLLLLVVLSRSADAQLFGPRSVGRNARGNQLTDSSTAGTITEDRRFIRGSRSADNFVGADRQEATAFVGSAQTINDGEVTTAVEGLSELPTARVNRSATEPRRGMYRPRLRIGFSLQRQVQEGTRQRALRSFITISQPLQELSAERGFRISHAPTERVATLTGTVATEHDRQIAELLARFEPGVETVKNDLQLAK